MTGALGILREIDCGYLTWHGEAGVMTPLHRHGNWGREKEEAHKSSDSIFPWHCTIGFTSWILFTWSLSLPIGRPQFWFLLWVWASDFRSQLQDLNLSLKPSDTGCGLPSEPEPLPQPLPSSLPSLSCSCCWYLGERSQSSQSDWSCHRLSLVFILFISNAQ